MRRHLLVVASLVAVVAACGSRAHSSSSQSAAASDDTLVRALSVRGESNAFARAPRLPRVKRHPPSALLTPTHASFERFVRPSIGTDDGGAEPTPEEAAAFDAVKADALTFLKKGATPGASVAVVLHGKLMFAAGVGEKDTTTHAPVTTNTLFRAASMSKMIVAATAMSLVEEGKLDLHAPITTYVPWFKLAQGFDASTITLHHLMTHTSGFPCDSISQCDVGTSGARKAFFQNNPQPLWAPPGDMYDYSNTGFALASVVLTSAAGLADTAYEQLAHDRVFVPANMTTATYDDKAAEKADYATGYDLDTNNVVTGTYKPTDFDCPLGNPPGGVLATASDYAHFAEAMIAGGGSMLKPASVALMESPLVDLRTYATQKYGYGLVTEEYPYPGHPMIWHDGALDGYLSELVMIPDLGFAAAVFTNAYANDDVPDEIAMDAVSKFIALTPEKPVTQTPPSAWANYVGTYDDDYAMLGTGVQVSMGTDADGGAALMVNMPSANDGAGNKTPVQGAMVQYAGDEWGTPDGNVVTFYPNPSGAAPMRYFVTRTGVGVRK